MPRAPFASVDDIIAMLTTLSKAGMGSYVVGVRDECYLARQDDKPKVDERMQTVDFPGYH